MPFSAPVLTYRAKALASNMCSKVLNGHIILTDTSITTILAPEMTYTPAKNPSGISGRVFHTQTLTIQTMQWRNTVFIVLVQRSRENADRAIAKNRYFARSRGGKVNRRMKACRRGKSDRSAEIFSARSEIAGMQLFYFEIRNNALSLHANSDEPGDRPDLKSQPQYELHRICKT